MTNAGLGIRVFPSSHANPLFTDELTEIINYFYKPQEKSAIGEPVCLAVRDITRRGTSLRNARPAIVIRSPNDYKHLLINDAIKDMGIDRNQLITLVRSEEALAVYYGMGSSRAIMEMFNSHVAVSSITSYMTPHGAISLLRNPQSYAKDAGISIPDFVRSQTHIDQVIRLHIDAPQSKHERLEMKPQLDELHRFACSLLRGSSASCFTGMDFLPLRTDILDA